MMHRSLEYLEWWTANLRYTVVCLPHASQTTAARTQLLAACRAQA